MGHSRFYLPPQPLRRRHKTRPEHPQYIFVRLSTTMAAYVPSMISGASASALAYGSSALGYQPPRPDIAAILPDVPTITLAARETGPASTRVVAVTVTAGVPPPEPARQPAWINPRTVPGQVVQCGDPRFIGLGLGYTVIHGTRIPRAARASSPTDLALPERDVGGVVTGAFSAICFRRARRDTDTVADYSDDVVPILCLPSKRDTPALAARQRKLTDCGTSFTAPTPAVAARTALPTVPEHDGAGWNVYLPDGRSVQEVADAFAEYGGYGLVMEPVDSVCYHRDRKDGPDDGTSDEDESARVENSVVCHPAGADVSAGEIGGLMV
ncbi:hypothetical protein CONLIGDRAFT_105516 [Coniochaeta ligniaria NRRL 30616]|uniref:Uncharacterized protein n=1 Tax=Coniochaeta ligniaria NRRL 30616 TaxID=1408157 RepID=A0A1J7IAQ4_9PEZI|nr:hypothetical protein CONLIGDRAFT_105516 [Coniochaeta ligniaria NRRL 30616]